MAWVGRDLKNHLVPTPLPWAELPGTKSGPTQPGLEYLQEWGIHNLSGQPVTAPHNPFSEALLPDISFKSSLF